ncbi:MAG: DNA-processing protein DprA [Bacteroidetes bacterium]|nr:DNA-processing protein DprA [Bacteroidota bacterium]
MKKEEATYWITLAHLQGWKYLSINQLIIRFYHENKLTIEEFFHLKAEDWKEKYQLDDRQILDLTQAKEQLASNAFLAESLLNQGYEIIPITAPDYSKTLKTNLKVAQAPCVIYVKGNKHILNEKSIAIVGSRAASDSALKFTDNIVKSAVNEHKIIVSGFAKGVDKQALDSALTYGGRSIIVLPQGIMTFVTGFKNYYRQIISGDVLVLSTFFPKAPWRVELAMARNPIIYGLSEEIYVAESSEKGGTWSGVIDGLRKGRIIYIRNPEPGEKNANHLLIQMGAIPVDFDGKELAKAYTSEQKTGQAANVNEPMHYDSSEEKIRTALSGRSLSAQELIEKLCLNWSVRKMSNFLNQLDFIEKEKLKGKNYYRIKRTRSAVQKTLFD